MNRCTTLLLFFAALAVLIGSNPILAGSLPPEQEVPEMMMELEGQLGIWLGIHYGPSEDLNFSSDTDMTNMTFSFGLLSGSTYAGQPASMTATGAFNSSTNQWDFIASGTVGGESWSSTGTAVDPPAIYDFDLDLFGPLGPQEVISTASFTIEGDVLFSQGTTVVKNAITGQIISASAFADAMKLEIPNKGKWNWKTGQVPTPNGAVRVSSAGFSPDVGGAGQFTTSITAVPEPASFALLATAVGMMLLFPRPQ